MLSWHSSGMASAPTSFDPGLTQQYTGPLLRAINKDGSFNVRRRGVSSLAGSFYQHLVGLSWPRFLSFVALAYLLINLIFAALYAVLGPGALRTVDGHMGLGDFAVAFFFSVHTLTTVGYGDVYPITTPGKIVGGLVDLLGIATFALPTGILAAGFAEEIRKRRVPRQICPRCGAALPP